MEGTEVRLKNFPTDLWARLRVRAAERGVTMKAIVVEALTAYLGKDRS